MYEWQKMISRKNHVFIYVKIYSVMAFKLQIGFSFAASYGCCSSWTLSWLTFLFLAQSVLSKLQTQQLQLTYYLWHWRKRYCHSEIQCRCCYVKEGQTSGGERAWDTMRLLGLLLWRISRGVGRCGRWMWRRVGRDWAPWWMLGGTVGWPKACPMCNSMQIWQLSYTLREHCPANILHTYLMLKNEQ